MIKITSAAQAIELNKRLNKRLHKQQQHNIPDIVISHMQQFEGEDGLYHPDIHGYILWLQQDDDISNIPDIAEHGLITILEECDQPYCQDDYQPYCFEHVELHQQKDHNIYEMIISIDADKAIVIFVKDAPWLDKRLKTALDRQLQGENNRRKGETP